MTPKERALFMMALFQTIHHPTIDCDNMFAKECAKRAIDEIIKAIDFDWMEIQNLDREHAYWHEVKKEIQAL